jgi:5-methyltetrahydrofolate--homocysteine methyltransferase
MSISAPSSALVSARAALGSPPPMLLSGLEPLVVGEGSLFVNVGERTNVTGSKAFARMILEGRYEDALAVARQQVENGAQIMDVNMDEAMLDSQAAMVRFPEPDGHRARHCPRAGDDRLSQQVERDRGRPALRAGQGVVNSISMKEGVAEFKRQAHAGQALRRRRRGDGL